MSRPFFIVPALTALPLSLVLAPAADAALMRVLSVTRRVNVAVALPSPSGPYSDAASVESIAPFGGADSLTMTREFEHVSAVTSAGVETSIGAREVHVTTAAFAVVYSPNSEDDVRTETLAEAVMLIEFTRTLFAHVGLHGGLSGAIAGVGLGFDFVDGRSVRSRGERTIEIDGVPYSEFGPGVYEFVVLSFTEVSTDPSTGSWTGGSFGHGRVLVRAPAPGGVALLASALGLFAGRRRR